MPNLSLKNVPAQVYDRLKSSARLHWRSINSEAIACLEDALQIRAVDVGELLDRVDRLTARNRLSPLTDELLERARNEARPSSSPTPA